jgi:hypothetical protein
MPRGGIRRGAGRKSSANGTTTTKSVELYDWHLRQIRDYAATRGISESEVVRIALEKAFPHLWTDCLLNRIPIKTVT